MLIKNKTYEEIKIGDMATHSKIYTKEEVEVFSAISDDSNPTHFDPTMGAEFMGSERVLGHAMWLGTLLSNIFGNKIPGPGAVYKSQTMNWFIMPTINDTITLTIKVIDKKPNFVVEMECTFMNQNQELLASGIAEVFASNKALEVRTRDKQVARLERPRKIFDAIEQKAKDGDRVRVSVINPTSDYSLLGMIDAEKAGLIEPIIVAPREEIKQLAKKLGIDISKYELVDVRDDLEAAKVGVKLVSSGKAAILMKGNIHTDEMMHEVMNKEYGLRTNKRVSHNFIMDIPQYNQMLLITDAAINIAPDLETKVDILKNAILLAKVLGVEMPKVAVLSAVETIYPKIPSTLEAAALCKMVDRGQIKGCIIDGPLAFDNAISKEAAKLKGINSPVAGQADIFLMPGLEAANMVAKQLYYLAGADMAGVVIGASAPIVLTSRADSPRSRLASTAAAVLLAHAAMK